MNIRRVPTLAAMLLLAGGILAQQPAAWQKQTAPLMTRWSAAVSPENALPEYPRPQLVRSDWQNLNGLWQFAPAQKGDQPPVGRTLDRQILVPFAIESALSGIKEVHPHAWYRRSFTVPAGWNGRRLMIHFGAVDFEANVYVNGVHVGAHRGGYDGFSFDITDYLTSSGPQELIVGVYDPTNEGVYPRGKQVNDPSGIFYTSVTGIWQTVWLEPLAEAHIADVHTIPDIDRMVLKARVDAPLTGHTVRLRAMDGTRELGSVVGRPGEDLEIKVAGARLWSPEDPALYDLSVELLRDGRKVDDVKSYFGMRKISLGKDEQGRNRLFLNNKFVFQVGPLDQGYWPDGLYTAPTDEALRFDIEAAKAAGFNMIRKHAKVEPQRWYYWTDKLGMLVWQDMPSVHPNDFARRQTAAHRTQYEMELKELVHEHWNAPSIIMWTVFNEAWGQYDTPRLTRWTKSLDPSRIVSNASGWTDFKVGDVIDMHKYPDPGAFPTEPTRASVLGEFGGLGLPVQGRLWQDRANWGYQAFTTNEALQDRYQQLYEDVFPLVDDPGLSAVVYTQITDVEGEINGLMTYDREVWKIPVEVLRAIHTDKMISPPVISPSGLFLKSTKVTLTNRKGETIRYTLDGSEPTTSSKKYTGPFTLSKSATVKARSFGSDDTKSRVVSADLVRATKLRASDRVRSTEAGLNVAYFEGLWTKLPDFSSLTATATGTTPKFDLAPAKRELRYALRFTGYVEVPADGVYTFYSDSDDGTRLLIGGEQVILNDEVHGMIEVAGQVALKAGKHPITLDYFQGTGGSGLKVSYEGPGIKRQEIPASALSH